MAETYECPFITSPFSRYNKKTHKRGIWCEGGGVWMPVPAWKQYAKKYCMNQPGWKDCTIAKKLLEYYEREDEK